MDAALREITPAQVPLLPVPPQGPVTLRDVCLRGAIRRFRAVPSPLHQGPQPVRAQVVLGAQDPAVVVELRGSLAAAVLQTARDDVRTSRRHSGSSTLTHPGQDTLAISGSGFRVRPPMAAMGDWVVDLESFSADAFARLTTRNGVTMQYNSTSGCFENVPAGPALDPLSPPASLYVWPPSPIFGTHPSAGLVAPPAPVRASVSSLCAPAQNRVNVQVTYEYRKISELDECLRLGVQPTVVSFYGIVTAYSPPEPINANDKFKSWFKATDESLPATDEGVMVVCFAQTLEQLPQVRAVGEIVRCHRVQLDRHQGKVQAKAKRGAVVVFSGDDDAPFTGRSHADIRTNLMMSFTVTEADRDAIRRLRTFRRATAQTTLNDYDPYRPLLPRHDNTPARMPAPAQVPSPAPMSAPEAASAVTMPAPATATAATRALFAPPPSVGGRRARLDLAQITLDTRFCDMTGEVIQINPRDNNAVDLVLVDYTARPTVAGQEEQWSIVIRCWDEFADQVKANVPVNSLVVLVNISLRETAPGKGVVEGVMRAGRFTSFEVYDYINDPDNAKFTQLLARRLVARPNSPLNKRKAAAAAALENANGDKRARPLVSSNFVNSLLRKDAVPKTPLRDVVRCDEPNTFIVDVSVIGYNPADFRDFSRMYCTACEFSLLPCVEPRCPCCGNTDLSWVWLFSFRMADATAEISAIAFGADAQQMLMGLQAGNLYENRSDLETLKKRMNMLFDPGFEPHAGASPTRACIKHENEEKDWNDGLAPGARAPRLTVALRTYKIADEHGAPLRRVQLTNTALVYE